MGTNYSLDNLYKQVEQHDDTNELYPPGKAVDQPSEEDEAPVDEEEIKKRSDYVCEKLICQSKMKYELEKKEFEILVRKFEILVRKEILENPIFAEYVVQVGLGIKNPIHIHSSCIKTTKLHSFITKYHFDALTFNICNCDINVKLIIRNDSSYRGIQLTQKQSNSS